MERTSEHLSAVTKMTGLLLAPPLRHTTINRVELIPLEHDRALAVLVTDSGWVTARAISVEPPLSAEEVRKIGRELMRRFRDRTVANIVEMETAPADPLDELHTRARAFTDQVLEMLRGRTLYISGAINMLDHPEFWDLETTRELLGDLENRDIVTRTRRALDLEVVAIVVMKALQRLDDEKIHRHPDRTTPV